MDNASIGIALNLWWRDHKTERLLLNNGTEQLDQMFDNVSLDSEGVTHFVVRNPGYLTKLSDPIEIRFQPGEFRIIRAREQIILRLQAYKRAAANPR